MENNDEIDLKKFFRILWKSKETIIIITIIAILLGFIYTMYILKPKYTAYTKLIMVQTNSNKDSSQGVTSTDVSLNDKLISTYQSLATTNSVVREVINNLNLDENEDELKNEISVTTEKSTQVLKISVTDDDPQKATDIANELSNVFAKKVSEIYKIDNINIVDKAELPDGPSNINHKKDIFIFGIVGFIIAIMGVLLKNLFDNTISSADEVQKELNLIVLSEVPDCTDIVTGKKR